MLGEMDELKSGDIPGLTPRIVSRYGRPFIDSVLNQSNTPLFRNILRENPTYTDLFVRSFPDAINSFYSNYDSTGSSAINYFDNEFGTGIGQMLLDMRGD